MEHKGRFWNDCWAELVSVLGKPRQLFHIVVPYAFHSIDIRRGMFYGVRHSVIFVYLGSFVAFWKLNRHHFIGEGSYLIFNNS